MKLDIVLSFLCVLYIDVWQFPPNLRYDDKEILSITN